MFSIQLRTALLETLSVQCPVDFLDPPSNDIRFLENFELSPNERNYGYNQGSHEYEKEPLCGRGSMCNNKYLYQHSAPGTSIFEFNQAQYVSKVIYNIYAIQYHIFHILFCILRKCILLHDQNQCLMSINHCILCYVSYIQFFILFSVMFWIYNS